MNYDYSQLLIAYVIVTRSELLVLNYCYIINQVSEVSS